MKAEGQTGVHMKRIQNSWIKAGFLLYLFGILVFPLKAQENIDSLINNDLPFFEELVKSQSPNPDLITADTLYAKYVPLVDMETIEDRASCLNLDMPLVINKTVCGFIHFFTVRKRNYTQTMLERKNYYFPIFEYYLQKHQMPDALKYLAIVESGLNFKARSRTGAVGLWQFMPGTGKDFYLAQNQHIDERQNPYLATEAACKFLKYLHGMFNDWELALAAYNCGPGNVMKAMRKSGKRGFWEIYNFLPQETRSYVPQFHAVVYSMNFAAHHNIHADFDSVLVTVPLDTFNIAKSFDVYKLESILGLPQNSLLHHNPTLRSNFFPGGTRHSLLVPITHSTLLSSNFNQYIDSSFVELIAEKPRSQKTKGFKYITVRKGEKISTIASTYHIERKVLCEINHLNGEKIDKTRKLKLPVERQGKEIPDVVVSRKIEKGAEKSNSVQEPEVSDKTYKVNSGEKLYQIAIKFGVTTKELRSWNRMKSSFVKKGQILQVKALDGEECLASKDSCITAATVVVTRFSKSDLPSHYTVRKGDRLSKIAKVSGLTMHQIHEFNPGLGTILKEGERIRIISEAPDQIADSDSSELTNTVALERLPIHNSKIKNNSKKELKIEIAKTYLVQKGDTLYSITKKFTKLSIRDLMRINKLKSKNIKPGQQLIVG